MVLSEADDDWIDNTMDDAIGLPDPPGSNDTLYIPDFVTEHVHEDRTEEEKLAAHALFHKKDWLTPGLIAGIHGYVPQDEDNCTETGQRSMESFKEHCIKLFPLNCVFASSSQILQAAKEFWDARGVSSTCLGKKIVCYYGKSPIRNQPQRVNLGVTRMRVPSLKSQECPFEICFNWIKLKTHVAGKAKLLLQVKVTFCNPNHTCKMDTHSHRTALQKAGRLCLDFGKVKSLLFLLLEKPRLDTNTLRPYLAEALPHYKGVTAQFAVNFRNRVFEYHTKSGGNSELTMEDAAALTSHKKSAADEMISTDDPILPRTTQIFFDGFLLKTLQPGRPSIVQGMITRYRKEKAFVVHFDDHLPVGSQVDQDNNTNAC